MGKTIFLDIDTQVDFIMPYGKLYIKNAERLLTNLKLLTDFAHKNNIQIVATSDSHSLTDKEISNTPNFIETFPPHCISNTDGAKKIKETELQNPLIINYAADISIEAKIYEHNKDFLILKKEFDMFSNPFSLIVFKILAPQKIVVYGVATDVCVKFAIEGLLNSGYKEIWFVKDASEGIDPAKISQLLRDWESRGVKTVFTFDIIGPIV